MSQLNNLIKKKNLRRKKGKKKWSSNIDVSNLQEAFEQTNTDQRIQEGVKKKIKKQLQNQPLFVIDQQPDSVVQSKLDKDRFKKKQNLIKSKFDTKKISKLAENLVNKKQESNDLIQKMKNNKKDNDDEDLEEYDLWDEKPVPKINNQANQQKTEEKYYPHKPVINMNDNPNKISSVVLPVGGQSYNPSLDDHQKLIQNIVEIEKNKGILKPNLSKKLQQKKIKKQKLRKPKSVKEKLLLEAAQQRKSEKEFNQQFFLLKTYKKQMKETSRKTQEKLAKKQELLQQETQNNKKGIVKIPKKIGHVKYEMKIQDFQLENQIAPNLRQVKSLEEGKSIVRGQFDTIFRKNLIEKTRNLKRYKRKVPKYKFRETVKDEDFIKTLNIQS